MRSKRHRDQSISDLMGKQKIAEGKCKDLKHLQVEVSTSRGIIYGFHVDYGNDASKLYFGSADVLLGIPYARQPVGHLRFARTVPLLKFKGGKHNASSYGKYCPQGARFDKSVMSEGCLKLNIFTPSVSSRLRLPVMVYIHGGGFAAGGGRDLDMPGAVTNFVSRHVVVVTLQYRLGVLGFFTTHTDDFPPNRGLHDSATALQWVYEEIEAFGGDKSRITVFGVSAGSCTVAALTLSPLTRGIIHQAIMQSGGSLSLFDGYLSRSERSESIAETMCNVTKSEWESKRYGRLKQCMHDATIYTILAHDDEYGKHFDCFRLLVVYQREGREMAKSFNSTTYKKLFDRIAGNVTEDSHSRELIYTLLSAIYVKHNVPMLQETDHGRWLKAAVETLGGLIFIAPIAHEAEWYRNNNNTKVFIYQYEYESNLVHTERVGNWKPVVHGEEICPLFLNEECWKAAERENRTTSTDHVMADRLAQMWTDFAKNERPSSYWEPFDDDDSFKYLAISYNSTMKSAYGDKHRYAWNDILQAVIEHDNTTHYSVLSLEVQQTT
uniref:Carboxylic ester hydrolase n=1 Tax=Ascaris lumbricoides TaxID=6252 RepID=A0A9J2PMI7_ASCLU